MPDLIWIELEPAATLRMPSLKIACASTTEVRGAVARRVVGLGRDLADELGAHVLEAVLDLDLLGDGHAVVDDGRGAELLLEDDVASARSEGDLDGVRELVDAGPRGGDGRRRCT